MLIGLGVASTNRTDKFWHTGSAEEFDGWGVHSYARVWRSYLQAVLNECYFWFRQCGDVINLCNSALFVLWYYRCMGVIFDWNLGNMTYNGLITLRHCGFPFAEIGVASVGIRAILDHRTKPLEMDDRIGCEKPFFRLYTNPAFTSMKGLSIVDLLTPIP